jgi:hypothetical protein
MKRLVTAVVTSTILAATGLSPFTGHAAFAQSKPAISVTVVSVNPTTVTAKHAAVTFHLSVKGMVLDGLHMGKVNVSGHGHIQLYVDKVPSDAYARKDLQHWLASLATTTLTLNLSPAIVGGTGKHKIIVALAQNNGVLYSAPTASITITVK